MWNGAGLCESVIQMCCLPPVSPLFVKFLYLCAQGINPSIRPFVIPIINMSTSSASSRHLAIVIPCYNEEEVLPLSHGRLSQLIESMGERYPSLRVSLFYVDDGSTDKTWSIISRLSQTSPYTGGLRLAHNEGHQYALWAGLEWAAEHTDAAISIDADLQDDIQAIPRMIDRWNEGADIVYGVRADRPTDTAFKKYTAQMYYRLLRLAGGDVVYNHADFRLMSRRALCGLMQYPERGVFLRGMVRTLGFREAYEYYDRSERLAGESKYPLRRMLALALEGITSFSVRPLQCITYLGVGVTLLSLLAIIYALTSWMLGRALPGWTSLLISVWFIGGAVLTSMGVIGIYIGKIYNEVKRRPRYLIDQLLNPGDESEKS